MVEDAPCVYDHVIDLRASRIHQQPLVTGGQHLLELASGKRKPQKHFVKVLSWRGAGRRPSVTGFPGTLLSLVRNDACPIPTLLVGNIAYGNNWCM